MSSGGLLSGMKRVPIWAKLFCVDAVFVSWCGGTIWSEGV